MQPFFSRVLVVEPASKIEKTGPGQKNRLVHGGFRTSPVGIPNLTRRETSCLQDPDQRMSYCNSPLLNCWLLLPYLPCVLWGRIAGRALGPAAGGQRGIDAGRPVREVGAGSWWAPGDDGGFDL